MKNLKRRTGPLEESTSIFENGFVPGVRMILFIMEKGFKLNAAKKFLNILLNREFVKCFGYRNKIQALTEDGALCVGKRKSIWNSNYGAKAFKWRVR